MERRQPVDAGSWQRAVEVGDDEAIGDKRDERGGAGLVGRVLEEDQCVPEHVRFGWDLALERLEAVVGR